MTAVTNPRRRLAPRTSARQCAPGTRNHRISMLHGFSERLDYTSRSLLIIANHHQRRKTGPQKHPPEHQMLFNIHIPNQDHRDRG
jgi:hypothetical protein